jgi:uncharacterized RDD family membrane protein YckC
MNKASLGSRAIAIIIDSILVGVVSWIIAGIFGRADLGGLSGFILTVLYDGFFWTNYNGQTPGKMVMKIRVVKTSGAALTWTDAVIRVVGYFVNTAVIFIGWIWAFMDADRQGWHDKLASTYVVDA